MWGAEWSNLAQGRDRRRVLVYQRMPKYS
jgi:hypothetical protein